MFLAYAALDRTIAARTAALELAASVPPKGKHLATRVATRPTADVDRAMFVRVAAGLLADTPEEQLSLSVEAYMQTVEALAADAIQAQTWIGWNPMSPDERGFLCGLPTGLQSLPIGQARAARARRVDDVSCVVLPCAFLTSMVCLFGLDFEDSYGDLSAVPIQMMFSGLPSASWQAWSAALTFLIPLGVAAAWFGASRAKRRSLAKQDAERAERLRTTWTAFFPLGASRRTDQASVRAALEKFGDASKKFAWSATAQDAADGAPAAAPAMSAAPAAPASPARVSLVGAVPPATSAASSAAISPSEPPPPPPEPEPVSRPPGNFVGDSV